MENQNQETYSGIYYDIYNDIANCRNLTSEQLTNLEKLTPEELKEIIKCYNKLIQSLKDAQML